MYASIGLPSDQPIGFVPHMTKDASIDEGQLSDGLCTSALPVYAAVDKSRGDRLVNVVAPIYASVNKPASLFTTEQTTELLLSNFAKLYDAVCENEELSTGV